METWNSVDDILRYAISQEEEAAVLYRKLASGANKPGMRQLYEGFAREEEGHKAKLMNIKIDKLMQPARAQTIDMKMTDYLVEPQSDSDLGYQEALILAMKREKAAFRLYSDLAEQSTDPELKATLLSLAQEEAKHKLRFEIEYDDVVQSAN
jgi:rubrerythrin